MEIYDGISHPCPNHSLTKLVKGVSVFRIFVDDHEFKLRGVFYQQGGITLPYAHGILNVFLFLYSRWPLTNNQPWEIRPDSWCAATEFPIRAQTHVTQRVFVNLCDNCNTITTSCMDNQWSNTVQNIPKCCGHFEIIIRWFTWTSLFLKGQTLCCII